MTARFTLLFLLLSRLALAQTFTPVSGPLLQQEVAFQQANECYIYFDNPSGDSLTLRWRQLEISMPEGWDVDLCDYGLCYIGIPNNGTMQPVADTIQPYLKLIVQPELTPGAAWLWFRVWEEGNADNFQDVYFSLHTPGTVGAQEAQGEALRVFPNPVSDFLFLENNQPDALTARLFDANGQLVGEKAVPGSSRETWPVGDLPTGNYFLKIGGRVKIIAISH